MIEHFTPDGRRVYTIGEAAHLRVGPDAEAVRREKAAIRQRLHRSRIEPVDYINPREPVYFPEDLGITGG